MRRAVFQAFKGLTRREGAVQGRRWWEDQVTGEELGPAICVLEEGYGHVKSPEFEAGIYEFQHCFEYPLPGGWFWLDWFDPLAALVGYDRNQPGDYPQDGPFFDILTHRGATLGPIASAKLVADFDAWDERARSFLEPECYLIYWAARTCFSHAAQGGAVQLAWLRLKVEIDWDSLASE